MIRSCLLYTSKTIKVFVLLQNVLEPDAEMVSEDELPAEMSKEQLDTEAVSDEELPTNAEELPPTNADLPETEAVSEDELPLESAEKKKIKKKKTKSTSMFDSNFIVAKEAVLLYQLSLPCNIGNIKCSCTILLTTIST